MMGNIFIYFECIICHCDAIVVSWKLVMQAGMDKFSRVISMSSAVLSLVLDNVYVP